MYFEKDPCVRYKDKLTLEDFVHINPYKEGHYRNRFLEANAQFFEDFTCCDTTGVLRKIIDRAATEDPSWVKSILKTNSKFQKYLK